MKVLLKSIICVVILFVLTLFSPSGLQATYASSGHGNGSGNGRQVAAGTPNTPGCYSYQIGPTQEGRTDHGDFYIQLWFNSCNGYNYGSVTINNYFSQTIDGEIRVRRQAGPDGPAAISILTCRSNPKGDQVCTGAYLYSPNNLAQACFYVTSDFTEPSACTNYY